MNENPLQKLIEMGQNIWLNEFNRKLLQNGTISRMIENHEITGIVTNPLFLIKLIIDDNIYDNSIKELLKENPGITPEDIYEKLLIEDIKKACDLLLPIFEESDNHDGFVSVDISPLVIKNTDKIIKQAKKLKKLIDKPNILIKIPATGEGIRAFQKLIKNGINNNVTFLYSLDDFIKIYNAYTTALKNRCQSGREISEIISFASFSINKINIEIEKLLKKDSPLNGLTAIQIAQIIYEEYSEMLENDKYEKIKKYGGRIQKIIWTDSEAADYRHKDLIYIEKLIGINTITALSIETFDEFKQSGRPEKLILENNNNEKNIFEELKNNGINLLEVTEELKKSSIESYIKEFNDFIINFDKKIKKLKINLS